MFFIGFATVEGGVVGRGGPAARRSTSSSATRNLSVLSPAGLLETKFSLDGNIGVVGLAVEPGGAVVAIDLRPLSNLP